MTWRPALPPPTDLTYGQYQGWNCCWCNASLRGGGVSAGVSRGGVGAYGLDTQVYECGPHCPERPGAPNGAAPQTPAAPH